MPIALAVSTEVRMYRGLTRCEIWWSSSPVAGSMRRDRKEVKLRCEGLGRG